MSIACMLTVSIYSLGAVSGANFNPAVSVALGISKAMGGPGLTWGIVGIYSAAQIAGGLAAALCYRVLFGSAFQLMPAMGFGWLNAGLCEMCYTFLLCFVVLNVAAARKNLTERNQYYGLAIGFVILAGAYGAGAVSGGCFNPAVAIAIDVSYTGVSFAWCVAYAAFELLGACIAAGLFVCVRPEDFGGQSQGNNARLLSEFLGTFMLVLTVGLNVLGKSHAGALSIAAALMSMIYAVGDISGAHFNPAVTLAIFVSGRVPELTQRQAGLYMITQVAASFAAGLTYLTIHVGKTFPLGPVGASTWVQVTIAEFIFTFLLCYVVLSVAVSTRTRTTHMFGLAIGACVIAGGFAIGSISGGSLNPAVSLGVAGADMANGGLFYNGLLYSAIELAAGAAAAWVFSVTHAVDTTIELKSTCF
eukprot:TRINITY_DN46222_c0_g1_i1.p1 TRINITY_DN46222_c0_g1~~TRINITY_DN46222_c0_g1_i1.p1  ORF type:complete len:484 (+),score=81.60 TRINITY_DN46222_c0_g1_i1:200-1453(+)